LALGASHSHRFQRDTLPVGIAQFIGQYSTPYELVAAAVFILYLVLHRQFEQGVAEGAVNT
jgi:ABC-type glycerol-3-phosphate transport system permease component